MLYQPVLVDSVSHQGSQFPVVMWKLDHQDSAAMGVRRLTQSTWPRRKVCMVIDQKGVRCSVFRS
jgi:hypothetical protein